MSGGAARPALRLTPETAAGWKQRIRTRVVRSRNDAGEIVETTVERDGASDVLMTVRSFYLDLAQWALDEPARWGPWAVQCPIRATDIGHKRMKTGRKARMDQRTRDRMPVLPILVQAVDRERKAAAARLESARTAQPGESFTIDGVHGPAALPAVRAQGTNRQHGLERDRATISDRHEAICTIRADELHSQFARARRGCHVASAPRRAYAVCPPTRCSSSMRQRAGRCSTQ